MHRNQPRPAVRGLVLAGGRSTRFGDADANKAMAQFGTRPLLGRVVDVIATATERRPIVAVCSRTQKEKYSAILEDQNVEFTFDTPAFEGPLAGVFGAVNAVETPWVFCCGCDMPLLSTTAIDWLVDQLAEAVNASASPLDALAVRHPDETLEPLHTLFRRAAVEQARPQVSAADGPRTLLAALDSVETVTVDTPPAGVPLEESTTNVNTREELDAVVPNQIASRQ